MRPKKGPPGPTAGQGAKPQQQQQNPRPATGKVMGPGAGQAPRRGPPLNPRGMDPEPYHHDPGFDYRHDREFDHHFDFRGPPPGPDPRGPGFGPPPGPGFRELGTPGFREPPPAGHPFHGPLAGAQMFCVFLVSVGSLPTLFAGRSGSVEGAQADACLRAATFVAMSCWHICVAAICKVRARFVQGSRKVRARFVQGSCRTKFVFLSCQFSWFAHVAVWPWYLTKQRVAALQHRPIKTACMHHHLCGDTF